ncbi:MAG: PD-(D/E)XK nuclease family protein [Verrucomicrobiota bacterium]|nr:PD-(D/E)XK nuclease family protein [Limisphaera sp.]MDW8382366.1 PD-(D/E)XK nuclease family protein [Verrucomicrobiota bacterium]
MQVRFWIGPAGSGKTRRCLEEIRRRLETAVEGDPLVLLAPRQMTFQLERQLLVELGLPGYVRLNVLSPERLCFWLWDKLGGGPMPLLSAEGRVMVFRALLSRLGSGLRVFGGSARGVGFAQELSEAWAECQRHRRTAACLRELASKVENPRLALKLQDLAALSEAYEEWLKSHGLVDAQSLPERVTELLESRVESPWIEAVWVDGFAELAPNEVNLLAALTRHCRQMTVTFCLERSGLAHVDWLSPWWVVVRAREALEKALRGRVGVELVEEHLEARTRNGRFDQAPGLYWLERLWAGVSEVSQETPLSDDRAAANVVRGVCCEDPLAEATFVAREVWRFVREGGRFREVLVLVRDLERELPLLRRVFGEYEIPCHWDRREPVGQHPLVVLTRGAMRLVARHWRQADWFSVLKCGLVWHLSEEELDALENQALACGWEGRDTWLGPQVRQWLEQASADRAHRWDQLLQPWRTWDDMLGQGRKPVQGTVLVEALRRLWRDLGVEQQLAEWAGEIGGTFGPAWQGSLAGAVHGTILEEMHRWLEDLELAFGGQTLECREWLPILEAGLASLTVGVIPPALDQVLVGTVDRSRQSEARLVFLMGWNEGIFPARPVSGPLLSEDEWRQLADAGWSAQRQPHEQRAREEHFAYVACTRARERLVITWCRRDLRGRVLHPSPFWARLRGWLPWVREEQGARMDRGPQTNAVLEPVHEKEWWPRIMAAVAARRTDLVAKLPDRLQKQAASYLRYVEAGSRSVLHPAAAQRLYGQRLQLSATQMERFMACPFQFFVWGGLLARERHLYEVSAADRGAYLHEVLAAFHTALVDRGRKWREVPWEEAVDLVRTCALKVQQTYRNGLFDATALRRLMAQQCVEDLMSFLDVMWAWMREGRYRLDPVAAEWVFGGASAPGEDPETACVLRGPEGQTVELTGRLDRVDMVMVSEQEALAAVMDYKSGRVKLDRLLLEAGVDLQLRVYLVVLAEWELLRRQLGVTRIRPVGAFYVPLRPRPESVSAVEEADPGQSATGRSAYQHLGVFDASALPWLEAAESCQQGEQFAWRRNRDGSLRRDSWQAMDSAAFAQFVEESKSLIAAIAARIWAGEVKPDPYRHGTRVACDHCECQAICRLDRHRHRFRRLMPLKVQGV